MPRSSRPTGTSTLGGPFHGYSAPQSLGNFKTSEDVNIRRIIKNSWHKDFTPSTINGHGRAVSQYRAINGLGDFLSRKNYVCGGPSGFAETRQARPRNFGIAIQNCDTSGVQGVNTNVKFVSDHSDYLRFKKQRAISQNFNDLKNGGDDHNGSYVAFLSMPRSRRLR